MSEFQPDSDFETKGSAPDAEPGVSIDAQLARVAKVFTHVFPGAVVETIDHGGYEEVHINPKD